MSKEFICKCRRCRRHGFDPWVKKIPWRRVWQPTPESLPGESRGQRSLAGHRVAKSRTCLKRLSTHSGTHSHIHHVYIVIIFKCPVQWCSVDTVHTVTLLCGHSQLPSPELFLSCETETLSSLKINSSFLLLFKNFIMVKLVLLFSY